MKYLHSIGILCAILLAGCASNSAKRSDTPPRAGFSSYFQNEDLALSMVQNRETHELTLKLINVSSRPLTNQYPETMFEGTICLLQEGAIPVDAYNYDFLRMRIFGLWVNKTQVLSPGAALTYELPMTSLDALFAPRKLDGSRPVFAYAVLEKFNVASPIIRLNGVDKINYPSAGELLQRGSGPTIGNPTQ